VYLALMGPQGMADLARGIMQRTRYAMQRISVIPGATVLFEHSPHFQEFVVKYNGRTTAEVNRALLERGIFGGSDLSRAFPDLGQSALYCISEVHTQGDIDCLAAALGEVLR
jgi:glycine dehydrogenase subunit 1